MILHVPEFPTFFTLLTCNENKWISGFSELTQKLTGLKQKYIKLTDDAQFDDDTYISCLSYILVCNCTFVSHLRHTSKICVCRGPCSLYVF